MSFEEARRQYPWLAAGARAEWDRTAACIEERFDGAVAPEREAQRAWNQRGLCGGGGLSGGAGGTTRTDSISEQRLHDAVRQALDKLKRVARSPLRLTGSFSYGTPFKASKSRPPRNGVSEAATFRLTQEEGGCSATSTARRNRVEGRRRGFVDRMSMIKGL